MAGSIDIDGLKRSALYSVESQLACCRWSWLLLIIEPPGWCEGSQPQERGARLGRMGRPVQRSSAHGEALCCLLSILCGPMQRQSWLC